jgi:hypothetical protein
MRHESVRNIFTIRDPRDCVASRQLKTKDTFENSLRLIIQNLSAYYPYYRKYNNTFFIRYEEMMQDAHRFIKSIAAHLRVTLHDDVASRIHEETSIENARKIAESLSARPPDTLIHDRDHLVDPLTMLHDNHIQGGICGRWRDEYTTEQKKVLMNALRPWLLVLGYETDDSFDALLSALG